MINDLKRLQYNFSDTDKRSIVKVCDKFPHFDLIQQIAEGVKVDGSTVLNVGEAFILAGIVRPYYYWIADQLENHPGIAEDRGIPQFLQGVLDDPF